MPLTASAVNLRGKPAKIGGAIAAVAGWLLLFGTLATAIIVGAIFQAIFPSGAVVGWIVGGVISTVGLVASLVLLFGGRALRRMGMRAARDAQLDALGTLAACQHGVVTAQMASESLGLPLQKADAFLTSLAKQPDTGVTLEVDDEGGLTYRFAGYATPPAWPDSARLRVEPTGAGASPVVDTAPLEAELSGPDEAIVNDPRTQRS